MLTAVGLIGAQGRRGIYVAIGVLAGAFGLVVGTYFALDLADRPPDLQELFGFIGCGCQPGEKAAASPPWR